MDSRDVLEITKEELKGKKEIGHGTDGRVLEYGNGELLKIYHVRPDIKQIDSSSDEDIKIYNKKDFKAPKKEDDNVRFYVGEGDGDYVRLGKTDALTRAVSRKHNVVKSILPQRLLYVDKKLVGCTVIRQKGMQIHKLTGMPLKMKKLIMMRVLEAVKELIDNNIYPVDLDNSPYSTKSIYVDENGIMEKVGHSHVLVSVPSLDIHIIDLDGKSTIYTDFKSPNLERQSCASFNRLMKEFLLKLDLDELQTEEDVIAALTEANVEYEYIDKITHDEMTLKDLYHFITSYNYRSKGIVR